MENYTSFPKRIYLFKNISENRQTLTNGIYDLMKTNQWKFMVCKLK